MKLITDPSFCVLCSDALEKDILRTAYATLNNFHDPLRANLFAFTIRELMRIIMERLAPDDEIKKTSWFQVSRQSRKPDDQGVWRKQRYRYSITGYISDATIGRNPQLNTDDACNTLASISGDLSKYAHISAGTYNLGDAKITEFQKNVEDKVISFAEKFNRTKAEIHKIVWMLIQDTILEDVVEKIPSDLDTLSSATSVDDVSVGDIKPYNIGGETFTIYGTGSIGVELNYGGGNRRNGLTVDDSYPLTFSADINGEDLTVEEVEVSVDNISFYE